VVGGYLAARHYGSAAKAFEPSDADGHLGVAWRSNRNEWIVTARGVHEARDGKQVRASTGLQGQWIHHIDGLRQWGVFMQSLEMRYPGQRMRDVRRTVAGLSHALVLRGGSTVYLGVHAGKSRRAAQGGRSGPPSAGSSAGRAVDAASRVGRFWQCGWRAAAFWGGGSIFAVQRREVQWRLALGASWVPAPGWRVTPQVEWSSVDATVPIFSYQRRLVSLTVRREF
jgi:hypothetical protein